MILADKIIRLRRKNGWSQEELAEQLGVSRQAVSKWEGGASIPDLDKIVRLSGVFGVSTDYLLKDEIERSEPQYDEPETDAEHIVTVEEAGEFIDLHAEASGRIAAAAALCILSPVCMIQLGGLADMGRLSEAFAGGVGAAVLLAIVAGAVAILILCVLKLKKYEFLEKESFSLAYGVRGIVSKRREEYEDAARRLLVAGVTLCIVGVIPLLVAGALGASDYVCITCTNVMLAFIALGVYAIIRSFVVMAGFDKLLQQGDYTEDNKRRGRRLSFLPGAYWCLATAVYLFWSFRTELWERTWIVWPVAGLLYVALYGILKATVKGKE